MTEAEINRFVEESEKRADEINERFERALKELQASLI